jgi:hypothetical protein
MAKSADIRQEMRKKAAAPKPRTNGMQVKDDIARGVEVEDTMSQMKEDLDLVAEEMQALEQRLSELRPIHHALSVALQEYNNGPKVTPMPDSPGY